jgi:hypothetical protein
MKRSMLFVLAFTLISTTHVWSQEKYDKYKYLTETANAIFEIEGRGMVQKPEEVAEVASRACKTLERLLADKEFIDDLYRMANATAEHVEYHRQLRRDLGLFVDSFLRPENELLKKAGLTDDAANHISWSASFLHDSLGEKPDPKRILDAMDKLRADICSGAATMAKGQDDAKARVQGRKRIKKWALGIGGVTLIVVDSATSAASGGLATASFTLGGAFVGAAVAQ